MFSARAHTLARCSSVELRLRDDAAAAEAASRGRETRNFNSAEPHHDNSSVFDSSLEWLDNAIKALHALHPDAPREVWFGFRVDESGVLNLFVRDSGAGMAPSRLEVWPTLGNAAREEPEPEHPADANIDPRKPGVCV